jgi:hypothetical protein
MSSLKDSSSFMGESSKPSENHAKKLEKYFKANMPRTAKNNPYTERLLGDNSKQEQAIIDKLKELEDKRNYVETAISNIRDDEIDTSKMIDKLILLNRATDIYN